MRVQRAVPPRPRRARATLTSTAAFVVLAALVPATASASDTRKADVELPYVCALPSGKAPVTVRISAEFPQRTRAGEAFTPTGSPPPWSSRRKRWRTSPGTTRPRCAPVPRSP
ncbi:hypothetical protein STENM223S_04780 [Streptomyces tendae]